jgi:acyl-CoA dehydrogenase
MVCAIDDLTRDQRTLRDTARAFARDVIRPVAAQHDETEETPWTTLQEAHRLGLDTYFYPAELGGGGLADLLTRCLVTEELSWGCAGIGGIIATTGLCAAAIAACGTPEQRDRFLRIFCDPSQVALGALAVTEADAGSDVSGLRTAARRVDGGWVLDGTKRFITNGDAAAVCVVIATEDRSLGWNGLRAFVVERGMTGWRSPRVERKMGVRAAHAAELVFEGCFVPSENLLGGDGEPNGVAVLKAIERTRAAVAASALGIARAAYEYALAYARARRTFGKPIAEHQAIAFKLADMATEIAAARLLVHHAARRADAGLPFRTESSMAKLKAGDVAMRVTDEAIQILGGYGYSRDFPVEKWHRDAKVYQILGGTAEIQRLVISRGITAEEERA